MDIKRDKRHCNIDRMHMGHEKRCFFRKLSSFITEHYYLQMKNNNQRTVLALMVLACGIFSMSGQEAAKKEVTVEKYTLMGQFEPDYVLPVDQRIKLKKNRITHQRQTKKILDTLDISDRKRRRLIRELKRSPFSEKVQNVITAETQFEDSADDMLEN